MPKKKRVRINVSGDQVTAVLESPKKPEAKSTKRNWKRVKKKV